ncbi:MAG: hypothetical protein DMD81_10680 [Candidatus Rokuibacteriota bacterium]|nr:MAG: hypothetical protein DMD81_10680 [Candidatus Rokubacteria bacterium]
MTTDECKHGLKSGCVYCHAREPEVVVKPGRKAAPKASRLSDRMNDRMAALKKRLREIRGE